VHCPELSEPKKVLVGQFPHWSLRPALGKQKKLPDARMLFPQLSRAISNEVKGKHPVLLRALPAVQEQEGIATSNRKEVASHQRHEAVLKLFTVGQPPRIWH
jgi:hypothetical protein